VSHLDLKSAMAHAKLGGVEVSSRMFKVGILLVLTLATAASSFGQTVKGSEPSADTLIVLQRGACEQRCAVYRVAIFADGTLIYQGRHFVRQSGLIKSVIPVEVLNNLIHDFEAAGFFQLEDNYGYASKEHCESIDAGEPTAILTFSNQGRSKTVLHNHGCVGRGTKQLTELEDKVDHAVGTIKWIK
jgi:uncharacterized protein DUF6438